jgi:hypothetical protein
MKILKLSGILAALAVTALLIIGCSRSPSDSEQESLRIAEDFVKQEATFQFDGIADTLKITGATAAGNIWIINLQFDSRQAGYGDRSGQMLAEVITPHSCEITVKDGKVTTAVMDGQWDMVNQRTNVEIKLAPIDAVEVSILESYPAQISVYIKGGLSDGCTTFNDITTIRQGNIVTITVTVKRPLEVSCPAIYTSFEKNVNLGSDFMQGTTYTLDVNDYRTTFEGVN